ncbi:MAG: (Fe-S)-binding protein [Dehalococcoidaceae bacterium]|nr:(Fe-S)-binding protein [Dehalococcoidaceae bacterium]
MAEKTINRELANVINVRLNRQLLYYIDICTRCGLCKDACHQYVATGDVTYLPAYRAELIRRVYKKYFTRTGRFMPSLIEGREPDDRLLDELYRTTYACTGCRRCMYYCPFSIDTTWLLGVAKAMLLEAGRGSPILTELAGAAVMKGENIDLFKDVILESLKDTEKEVQQITGDASAQIPVEKTGAQAMYVALAGTHTILPVAVIFHHARLDWTLSLFEAANYGYFLGDNKLAKTIADRIVDEAKRLQVTQIILSECGHAYRVMKFLYEAWAKEKLPFEVKGIVEVMHELVESGKIKLKKDSIAEAVTYHDPCQVGRNAGFYEEPRSLVKAVSRDYREMTPNREKNWCCGGGGGVVAEPAMDEFRLKTGMKKVEQIRATGARIVVSPCENCRLQLDGLNEKYNLNIKISSLMDLVADNLVAQK